MYIIYRISLANYLKTSVVRDRIALAKPIIDKGIDAKDYSGEGKDRVVFYMDI